MQLLGPVSTQSQADVGSILRGAEERNGVGQQLRLGSLAHPGWPYAGTGHAWRGFVERAEPEDNGMPTLHEWRDFAAYQKLNFGPELT